MINNVYVIKTEGHNTTDAVGHVYNCTSAHNTLQTCGNKDLLQVVSGSLVCLSGLVLLCIRADISPALQLLSSYSGTSRLRLISFPFTRIKHGLTAAPVTGSFSCCVQKF